MVPKPVPGQLEKKSEEETVDDDTHYHAVQRQLSVNFELIGGRHAFAGVQEHVRELAIKKRMTMKNILQD